MCIKSWRANPLMFSCSPTICSMCRILNYPKMAGCYFKHRLRRSASPVLCTLSRSRLTQEVSCPNKRDYLRLFPLGHPTISPPLSIMRRSRSSNRIPNLKHLQFQYRTICGSSVDTYGRFSPLLQLVFLSLLLSLPESSLSTSQRRR